MSDQGLDYLDLKNKLASYGNEEYLYIKEVAARLKLSEKYLIALIRKGQLKGFKLGDNWLTTSKWLEFWLELLKQELDGHLADKHVSRWASSWQKKQRPQVITPAVKLAVETALIIIFIFYYSFFLYQPGASSFKFFIKEKKILAQELIVTFNGFYDLPVSLAMPAVRFYHHQVSDEAITNTLLAMIDRLRGQEDGRVAGASAER